jgi:ferredoxin-NADP reductase/Na+-translocating ferredoxin:NAD+ oxidoreductase RnfD subunit
MYRIVLYELLFLLVSACVLGFFHLLPYGPVSIIVSTLFIVLVCWIVNMVFAKVFEAPSNPESTYITALILALIITPALSFTDTTFLALAFWAAALAMASKYILAIGKKHLFNPVAIAVVVTAFALNLGASWWVGTGVMLPFVMIGGFLVVRKIHRMDLVWAFIITAFTTILTLSALSGGNVFVGAERILLSTPLLFFASVMLTEPLTTPPTMELQVAYGVLVGFLFAPQLHVGGVYSIPELALVLGNIFSYVVSPKKKLVLTLKEIEHIATDTYDFVFTPDKQLVYTPGQYMEWTLGHTSPDSRGIRRYFTLASSPTERELRLGVKFYDNGSTFKKKLISMSKGETIVATGLAGDFVMPKNKKEKLVFIAGGIGVTPFRSQIQYLIDTKQKRDVVVLYSNKTVADIAYRDVFDRAEAELGIKTVYAITDEGTDISAVSRSVRMIDANTISQHVPEYRNRTYYLSGPRGMVTSFEDLLQNMGVAKKRIKTDFFPGFA